MGLSINKIMCLLLFPISYQVFHFLSSCLAEDPTERISAKAALQHKFFSDHELLPTLKDMVLLPTNVLRLLNVLDDPKYKNDDEIKGIYPIFIHK